MIIYNTIYFISFFTNLFLGFFILSKNKRSNLNRSFSLLLFSISGWIVTLYIFYFYSNSSNILNIGRLNYIFPELIAFFAFWFGYYFPVKTFSLPRFAYYLAYFWIIFLVLITLFTDLIGKNEIINTNGSIESVFGHYYILFVVNFIIFTSGFFILPIVKYKKLTLIHKQQVKILVTSFIFPAIFTFITNSILPFFFENSDFQHYGVLGPLFLVGPIAYVIAKHRLMGIRFAVSQVYTYFLVSFFAFIYIEIVIYLDLIFFDSFSDPESLFITIILIILFAIIIIPLIDKIRRSSDYIFYRGRNPHNIIKDLVIRFNQTIDLNKLSVLLFGELDQILKPDYIAVILNIESSGGKKEKIFTRNIDLKISKKDKKLISEYFKNDSLNVIITEELRIEVEETDTKADDKLLEILRKYKIAFISPMIYGDELIGFIALGEKNTGLYSNEDIEFLKLISFQSASAFMNAHLYSETNEQRDVVQTQKIILENKNKEIEELNNKLKRRVNYQAQDIKDKGRYLNELLDMKNDFLRVVNHQLNTPVSIIRGNYSLIKEDPKYTEKGLKAIGSGIDRIYSTLADFWEAYQIEGQRIELDIRKIDITKIINDQVEEKKSLEKFRERKLKIEVKKPRFKIPEVYCDPKNFIHAISNLLDNSIFYTEKGGITISYKKQKLEDGDYLKIFIKDTGVGISNDDQKSMYMKFARGKNASLVNPNGSGLGLYIAKRIIDDTGGDLVLEETELGKGTTFSFTLPIFDKLHVKARKEIRKKIEKFNNILKADIPMARFSKTDRSKPTVLMIEDEKYIVQMYSGYLNDKGYDVYSTSNIDDALVLVKTVKPDIILLDIILPKEESGVINMVAEQGWGFLEMVKKQDKFKNTPIVAFTNLNTDNDREKAKKLGAAGYLFKAKVVPSDVVKIIDGLVSGKIKEFINY